MRFRQVFRSLRRLSGRAAALPLVALVVLTTFACSLDKLTQPQGQAAQTLTAAVAGDTVVALGGTTTMTVTTSAGSLANKAAILYTSSDPTVATVDQTTGVVTGVKLGTANISAAVIAPEIGEVSATNRAVRVKYAGIKITAIDSLIAIGMTKVVEVRGTNAAGAAQAVIPFSTATTLASRDAAVYDVNSSGALVAKANGTARLFAQYDGLKDSVNVKVRQVARSIAFPTAVNNELAIQSLNKDRTLTITPKDSLGVAITGSTVAWSTSDATTVSVVAATGVARGLKLGTARVRATVDGKTDSIVARVTQVAGIITKSAGDVQSATVGTAVAVAPAVVVLDSGNTPVPNAAVTFAVASGGGSVTAATPTATAAGAAAVGSWTLGTTAGANTLTASADGASATFSATGTPGAPVKLIFTTQPSNSPAGSPLSTFRVAVADANDNVVTTSTNSITISLASGGGTLGGTLTVAAVSGVATFSAATYSATGVYTLTASATGLTPATSNAAAVFGPATKLAFTTQPVGSTATIGMAAFRVAIQDAAGNTVTSGTSSTATVTLTLNIVSGSGAFSSTPVTAAAVAGIATFTNVAVTSAGTYTISAAATGLTGATSSQITVAAVGPPAKLAFTVQPANGTAGAALADIKVTVQDANGVANTTSTASITLGIETNVGGATLSGGTATVAAVNGVATFTGIILNKSGTGYKLNATSGTLTKGVSNTFNVAAGAAFKLGFAAAIPNAVIGAAISPAVQVQVQDANGNLVATATNQITVTASGGTGTLSGGAATAAVNGVASFNALSLSAAGTYTLVATATGSSLQTGTSAQFAVVASNAAIKLAFITQPTNVASSTAISPAVQVAIQDASGNTVSSTASVVLSLATSPSGATVGGTLTRAAVAGIATFDNVTLPLAGAGYSFNAASAGLTAATSNTFNVSPGTPTKLAWVVQPQTTTAGVPFASDLQVQVLDAANNVVTTATNTVTIAYNNSAGSQSSTLKGTLSVAAVNGVATFPGVRITRASTGFTLFASATNLSGSTSNPFDITAGPATGLAFKQQPGSVVAGATQSPSIQVSVADSLGNTVTGATNSITLAINSAPSGGVMAGTATQAAVAGVATFADVTFAKSGSYTLSATATDLATVTSNSFFISAGTATKLGFAVQPTNTFVNAQMNPGTNSVQVQVQDALGNQVTSNATITIGIGTNPSGAVLNGTVSGNASFGSYFVPSDMTISKAGTGFTLTAAATGLTSATSTAFDVGAFSTASKLIFVQQPADNITDAVFRNPIKVAVSDQYGNVVTSAAATTINIGCQQGCTSSNTSAVTTSGVATFTNMTIGTTGTYTLAGCNSPVTVCTDVASSSFVVGANTAATSAVANGVYDVAISNGFAYYIEGRSATGNIKKVSLSDGTSTTIVTGTVNFGAGIVADATNVYWLEDGNGAAGASLVKKVSVNGGTVTTISAALTGAQPGLQTDGTYLFFTTNNQGGEGNPATGSGTIVANVQRQIQQLPKSAAAGTAATRFYTMNCGLGASCQSVFTISGTTMYYWRSTDFQFTQGIFSVPSAGGVNSTSLVASVAQPTSMAVSSSTIYWSTGTALSTAPIAGGSATGRGNPFTSNAFLAFDGSSLYANDQGATTVRKIDVTDFTSINLTTLTAGSNSRAMAFDTNFLFYADNSNPTKLKRVAK